MPESPLIVPDSPLGRFEVLRAPSLLERAVAGRGFAIEVNLGRGGSGCSFQVPEYIVGTSLAAQHRKSFAIGSDRMRSVRLRRGDIQILPADTSMRVSWEPTDFAILRLRPDVIDHAVADLSPGGFRGFAPTMGLRDPLAERLMATLVEQALLGQPLDTLYHESLIAVLAARLTVLTGNGRNGQGGRNGRAAGDLAGPVLERVLDYIEANLDRRLSLQELAGLARLGSYRFARAFREAMEMPPHRYVLARRIDRAKMLLSSTELSITEIAYAVGFSSHSHLTSTFKSATGLTPRDFRLAR